MGSFSSPTYLFMVAFAVLWAAIFSGKMDVLNALDSNREYSKTELQVVVGAFCLSPAISKFMNERPDIVPLGNTSYAFVEDGNIEDDDYEQSSIYAILYGIYKSEPHLVSPHGIRYQFTFNTWGFGPGTWPETEPERMGKWAYSSLVVQPAALEYMKENNVGLGSWSSDKFGSYNMKDSSKPKLGNGSVPPVNVLEIGCGTGAGANLITRETIPNAQYTALDMQQAAINTCKERHGNAENPGLKCQIVPNGVGHGDNKAPEPTNSQDFVVISETHIADMRIGELEKSIFQEVKRVLKPDGLFLWGNALPTHVWFEAMEYLPTIGFELVDNSNHTEAAVVARDLDKERVDMLITQILDGYHAYKLPYFGPRCHHVSERLLANFYRHPGTALYMNMVTGYDSYMHQAWRIKKNPVEGSHPESDQPSSEL